MNTNDQSQVATSSQTTEVKMKAYQKEFQHPSKPATTQISHPFSYPPSSKTYQSALLQKILNMPEKEMSSESLEKNEMPETTPEVAQPKRSRGRPPGAKNKPKEVVVVSETAEFVDTSAAMLTRGRKPCLRSLRSKLGLNQSAMASQLGVTQAMVSFIESGKMKPSEDLQTKITLIYRAN